MKRLVLALALLAAPSVAFAQSAEAIGVGTGISSSTANSGSVAVSQGSQAGAAITYNVQAQPSATSQRISGTQRILNVPIVSAPGLAAAGIESCLGSISAGVGFPGGGVSFGTSTPDRSCAARLDARTLWAFGLKQEAILRLCQQDEMKLALGGRCPQPSTVQTASITTSPSVADGSAGGIWLTEGRTGRERYCLQYDEAARRCRRWQ